MNVRHLSPGQIRAHASRAVANRARVTLDSAALPLRAAWPGETPLSPAEVMFGLERGLIARRHVQTVRCWP
jgi:hypothetical protein